MGAGGTRCGSRAVLGTTYTARVGSRVEGGPLLLSPGSAAQWVAVNPDLSICPQSKARAEIHSPRRVSPWGSRSGLGSVSDRKTSPGIDRDFIFSLLSSQGHCPSGRPAWLLAQGSLGPRWRW